MKEFLNSCNNNKSRYIDFGHLSPYGFECSAKYVFNLLEQHGFFLTRSKQSVNTRKIKNVLKKEELLGNSDLNYYLSFLEKNKRDVWPAGAIVVNCNPFTNGHRYLIETAASLTAVLYIFVVEEDSSMFSFKERYDLVVKGVFDLKNVVVIPSGKFVLSAKTFPEYFVKDSLSTVTINCAYDLQVFAHYIAPTLNIQIRFAGEEPFDNITRQYNVTMRSIFPQYNIRFMEIKRKAIGDRIISASKVRCLYKEKQWDILESFVPKTTFEFLKKRKF
jgi:[citrate (pro-3S)-lyase] ligase